VWEPAAAAAAVHVPEAPVFEERAERVDPEAPSQTMFDPDDLDTPAYLRQGKLLN
jgi:hypothetical protein